MACIGFWPSPISPAVQVSIYGLNAPEGIQTEQYTVNSFLQSISYSIYHPETYFLLNVCYFFKAKLRVATKTSSVFKGMPQGWAIEVVGPAKVTYHIVPNGTLIPNHLWWMLTPCLML